MKSSILAFILLVLIVKNANSQDTLYVYDNGLIVFKRPVSQIDSVVFNKPLNLKITDINGNIYTTKQFGNQIWMTENLKATRYSNGDSILTTEPAHLNTTGFDLTAEQETKYGWAYNGDKNLISNYGRLYTWYTITDPRNVCPSGWHVPSDADWNELKSYLENNSFGFEGSGPDIGKSLAANSNWEASTTNGSIGNDLPSNNTSSFNVQPAGIRNYQSFDYMGYSSYFWTTDSRNQLDAYLQAMHWNGYALVQLFSPKISGASVRCLKD